jgi:hypothetical protein
VKKFEARLKELEMILNNDAKTWLFEQLLDKSKWDLVLMRVILDMGSISRRCSNSF